MVWTCWCYACIYLVEFRIFDVFSADAVDAGDSKTSATDWFLVTTKGAVFFNVTQRLKIMGHCKQ